MPDGWLSGEGQLPITAAINRNLSTPPMARPNLLSCPEVRLLLFTVSDRFTIQGRGIVPLPELKSIGNEHFRVGDQLRLRRPDGTEDLVPIVGLDLLKPLNGRCQPVVMLLGKEKDSVPIGTEVWSIDRVASL